MSAPTSDTVPKPPNPSSSVRLLYGAELRHQREKRGLSRAELAQLLHLSASFIEELETAYRSVTAALAEKLDHVLHTDGFFTRYLTSALAPYPATPAHLAALEAEAAGIREWSPLVIPARFQTPAYGHAVTHAYNPFASTPPVPGQAPSPDRPDPDGRYEVVLDEAALLCTVGGRAVMAAQLRHLAALIRHQHAAIRVLPFSAGAHPGMYGPLKLLTFEDGSLIAHAGGIDHGILHEDPSATERFTRAHEQIHTLALAPEASLDLIEATAERYEAHALPGPERHWTIRTTNGITVTGYLPGWAEDDPSEEGVEPASLTATLEDVGHRRRFDGIPLHVFTTGGADRPHLVGVFECAVECYPHPPSGHPDSRCEPVVNIQVSPEYWMTDLGPAELHEVAEKFRAQADRIDGKVIPMLLAARKDWAAHIAPATVAETAPDAQRE